MSRSARAVACLAAVFALCTLAVLPAQAGSAAEEAILPPELPWSGKSRSLIVPEGHPWITPAERSGFRTTPSYDETMEWLETLDEASPEMALTTIGKSGQGRNLTLAVVSREGFFTPAALRASGKPTVFVQAGIHSGEIDGKDAGLMLLRDMLQGDKRWLLDQVNLLFLPIFNADGHERSSRFGRVNQRGPEEMGWRTTARNLNLNRDYSKAASPEMRGLLRALSLWDPDLYLDLHVTDGADYQYDITFGYNGPHAYSPAIARWLDNYYRPAVEKDLEAMGHVPGPLIFMIDAKDADKGVFGWTASPRFSNGYGDARHLATVLLENHSLKPYEQRVLGTYVFLEASIKVLADKARELRLATKTDRDRRASPVALGFRPPQRPAERDTFLGVESRLVDSVAAGEPVVEWTGKPVDLVIPYPTASEPTATVERPQAYWIPPQWDDLTNLLIAHGIQVTRLEKPRGIFVDIYRLEDVKLGEQPFEGQVRVTAKAVPERRRVEYPAGTARVSTDQPLGDLAILLLEPGAEDSFFQWGMMLEILQRTEYMEPYVLAPMAERMMAEDPELKAEFEAKLAAEPDFAADAMARLQWFYQRTPYYDDQWRVYPIGRQPFRKK